VADQDDIDHHIQELMNLHLPVGENNESRLREMIKFADWFQDRERAALYTGMAKKEIITRVERNRAAGPFYRGNTVEVIEDLLWWNGAAAIRPKVGIIGRVISRSVSKSSRYISASCPDEDYDYLIPTRFLSTDVGYEWSEDDGNPDRQYVTYNMPAYSIRKIKA